MSSLSRSRNWTLSKSVSSPPKTICSNCVGGGRSAMTWSLDPRSIRTARSREFGQPIANEPEQRRMTCASGGQQRVMDRIGPIVDQRLPRQSRYQPLGFVHQKIGCRKVPVVTIGGREGAVERTGGDACEPQRQRWDARCRLDARLDRRQAVEPALGAGKFRPCEPIAAARPDRRTVERRAAAGSCEEQLVSDRRI